MADLDEFQAAEERFIAAINAQDLDALLAYYHDHVVQFAAGSPFPQEGKAAVRQGFEAVFASHERVNFRSINAQRRVIDTTGVSWGHLQRTLKPKDGPVDTVFLRTITTWTRAEGTWLMVAIHNSAIAGVSQPW